MSAPTIQNAIRRATESLAIQAALVPGGTPCKRNPRPYQTETKAAINYAKHLCQTCPLRAACYAVGDAYNLEGIWGGTTEEDRTHTRRSAAAKRARAQQPDTQHTLDDSLFGLAS